MKIQCSVCEVAEASILCCADEAALCLACDEKIHAANKLASKHQRIPLSGSSSPMPKCDICQETVGYIFCLEDRALFCRKCDVAIHTANPYVSSHQRFLLTGVKVGLEPMESGASSASRQQFPVEKPLEKAAPRSLSKRDTPMPPASQYNKVISVQSGGFADLSPPKLPFAGDSAAGSIPQWQLEEYFGLTELNQNFGLMDNGSSRADSGGKFGGLECSSMLRFDEEEFDGDECLGQVPDASWMVPQIHSPPTASGLCWPKNYQQSQSEALAFVPDICPSSPHWNPHPHCYETSLKRRRQF